MQEKKDSSNIHVKYYTSNLHIRGKMTNIDPIPYLGYLGTQNIYNK